MARVHAKVRRWGSSLGIVVPSEVAKGLRLKAGDEVVLEIDQAGSEEAFGSLRGWAVDPQFCKDHAAVFVFEEPVDFAEGAKLVVDFARTWSCYKGGDVHCGKCGTCVERREAFMQAGVADPTEYASRDPLPPKPVAR